VKFEFYKKNFNVIIFITRKPSWSKGDARQQCVYEDILIRGGTPSNINVIYTSLKSTFSGLQFCGRQYEYIFIRLVVLASQICEITR